MAGITDLGVAAIRDGFRAGDFSAREVAAAFNSAVAKAKSLNAFVIETPEHALAAADAADQARASGDLKPLSGVPLGIKDLFATKGYQTTAGSHMLGGFEPVYDSTVSSKLFAAGAGMLGKLNMDEFAMGSSNETSYYGNVVSPWRRADGGNAALTPGGSSGGSAAAVAARIAPGVTGTDTGGLDPPARRLHRHHRHQADLWPLLALGRGRLCLVARPGWADGTGRARLRDPSGSHGRLRSEGFHLARPCRCRIGRPACRPTSRQADRHSEGISDRGRARRRSAASGTRASSGCAMRAPRSSKSRCRTPNMRCRPTTSSRRRRPRPTLARYDGVRYGLRERPAVEAGGGGLADMYAATRAAGFGAEVKRRIMIGTYVLSAGFTTRTSTRLRRFGR
jgi:aspartyl-tRNA(Asn)/glutamyl-tRNA(Gln) amidotransferase subunit A